jgi:hypothetical protein
VEPPNNTHGRRRHLQIVHEGEMALPLHTRHCAVVLTVLSCIAYRHGVRACLSTPVRVQSGLCLLAVVLNFLLF